jgi:hypothetical protein
MSTDIKILINEYFDSELEKSQEVVLFSILSQNEEARDYFKKLNIIRTSLNESREEFPLELEERIFHSIENKNQKKRSFFNLHNFFTVGSYAVAVILLIVSIFLFNKINDYKKEMDNAVNIISAKSETIELLIRNTLPTTEVKANFPNEIIIKSNL